EPVDRVRHRPRRRAGALRAARGGARPRLAQRAAGHRAVAAGGPRAAAAARPGGRAVRGVPGPGAGQGGRAARRGAVHVRDRGGQLPPGGDRGRRVRGAAAGADRRPAAGAARHRGEPGHRPAEAVRRRGPLVRRGRGAGSPPGDERLLAVAGRPGLGRRVRGGRHLPRAGAHQRAAARPAGARPGGSGDRDSGLGRAAGGTAGGRAVGPAGPGGPGVLDLPWAERGVIVAGDGTADPGGLLDLAAAAGWPVLAEPSSGARCGPNALASYQYLLDHPGFCAAHRPDLVICAGRPGLSRGQLAFLRQAAAAGARQVMLTQGPGQWADPARTATDVAAAVRLASPPRPAGSWLGGWQRAAAAARGAADAILDEDGGLTEPRLARDLAAALPDGALLWAASSQPIRDLDRHLAPRPGLRVLASRGASGIDGLVSAAAGAALAHQAAGGGPAAALLGDLALLHDAPGL